MWRGMWRNMNKQSDEKRFVIMTDKFMSGWGKAEGKINKYIIECESLEQAKIVEENAKHREEMKYIGIHKVNKYRDNRNYLVSLVKAENTAFTIPGYFGTDDQRVKDLLWKQFKGSK